MAMKKWFFVLVLLGFALPVMAGDSPCKKREAAIQAEIDRAKKAGEDITGLEVALASHKATCNDDDLLEMVNLKLQERKLKVSKAELELKEAKTSGKADKIAKKELKLQEARIELREAEANLAALQ